MILIAWPASLDWFQENEKTRLLEFPWFNIAQTPASLPVHHLPTADWYRYKIDQCARRTRAAVEPNPRRRFEAERKLWLQILAEEIGAET